MVMLTRLTEALSVPSGGMISHVPVGRFALILHSLGLIKSVSTVLSTMTNTPYGFVTA